MLDSRPPVAPRTGVRCQRVKGAPHGPVADGVQADVEPGSRAPVDDVRQIILAQPSSSRAVQHLRGPAAERAIEKCFDAPRPEPRVAPARTDSHALGVRQVPHRQVVGDSDLQPALGVEPLQRAEGPRAVHRVDRRHAEARQRTERPRHRLIEQAVAGHGHQPGHFVHRRLAQDPRRLPEIVAIDHAARRVIGRAIDLRPLERRARDPGRVAVFAVQKCGAIASGGVQLLAVGERRVRPRVVVPA